MAYRVEKTFPAGEFSCCFRQHRADSHCSKLHGYALSFSFVWTATELDHNGWVIDFGALKKLKAALKHWFDHTTVVAADDPRLDWFKQAEDFKMVNLRVVPQTGCEAFATIAANEAVALVERHLDWFPNRPVLLSCVCREHDRNAAIYVRDGVAS